MHPMIMGEKRAIDVPRTSAAEVVESQGRAQGGKSSESSDSEGMRGRGA